jgi:phosphoserine phosphatase
MIQTRRCFMGLNKMSTVVLQGALLTEADAKNIAAKLQGELVQRQHYTTINTTEMVSPESLEALRQAYNFDINAIPADFKPQNVKLLVSDMDSTLISIECVDEIADYINAKPQVAAITEAAMRGDIDFETSLRQRVSLLKGLDVGVLAKVYQDRLTLNPGAELMLETLHANGVKTALVSGGFTFFTDRLKAELDLDYTLANVLEQHDSKLTGQVLGDICGAKAKADFLLERCKQLAISPSQVVAMGDGANDLLMMDEAGLSIAYHAKPKVQDQAKTTLNYCGLEGVLGLLQLDFN